MANHDDDDDDPILDHIYFSRSQQRQAEQPATVPPALPPEALDHRHTLQTSHATVKSYLFGLTLFFRGGWTRVDQFLWGPRIRMYTYFFF